MVPAAKRPRKDPAYRDPPAPRNSPKRKAESLLPVHEDFGAREEVTEEKQSASTQTNSNNAHRSSYYLVIMKRLRAQVAYQRSKCAGLLRKLAVDKEKMNEYNDDKHYIAVKKIVADSQKALCHLQENRFGDPALYSFRGVSPTILFMKMMKQWFDVHDTVYSGSDNKKPISDENDHRILWLEKDFTCYVRNIQEESIASGKGEFTDETYSALLFTTKATVETSRPQTSEATKEAQLSCAAFLRCHPCNFPGATPAFR
ncbi:hypothetical protein HPB49_003791 [Dermacentor silvarum]|uniref:Uncharacterized protein n=1 Tax=Dermacentor silvarum TaxID=543639 RepID=A0ACB8DUT3_DERSI|nr:hypothetical protein HPB49_003791 [Dermacentor silvarum]